MKEKLLKRKLSNKMILVCLSLLIPLLGAIGIMSTYGIVKNNMKAIYQNPLEQEFTMIKLFRSNLVLYRDLYEKTTGKNTQYTDIYLEDIEAILGNKLDNYSEEEVMDLKLNINKTLNKDMEKDSSSILELMDYYVEDTRTGTSISNTATSMPDNSDQYFYYLEIVYDENGSSHIADVKSEKTDQFLKSATKFTLTKNEILQEVISESSYLYSEDRENLNILEYGAGPKNCRMIYGMTQEDYDRYSADGFGVYPGNYYSYVDSGIMGWVFWAFIVVFLLAFLLPINRLVGKPFNQIRGFNLQLEVVIVLTCVIASFYQSVLHNIVNLLEGKTAAGYMSLMKISSLGAVTISYLTNALILWLLLLSAWYLGLTVRPLLEKGIKKYIMENCFIYRIFPFCKRQIKIVYDSLEHIDVTKNAGKMILKIVLINAVILFIISSFWIGGFMFIIIYSVVLYFGSKLYVSRMQKKYGILLSKIQEISAGNLNVEITEDLGIFEPFKEQLLLIQTGFRNAVDEEVKSQKMRSELITNVSHDLKTPLTAIITYIDLLKEENITIEQQKEYLKTLERKSLRLKILIEDLFEVSKATSGNVTMNYMDVDICNLVKQVEIEMSDKLEQAGLDVRMDIPKEKVIVSLDNQKTYRVFENLFQNIAKYAMPGTRVYIQGVQTENQIIISLKNISATEITVNASDLMDRFVRGDVSRNTEGSGLGLAIAKSFVELQGGKFVLESDGDLFKVLISFPCKY